VRTGNLQTARQGLPFPAQLTTSVADAAGRPLPGARVTFRVWSGGASFAGGARVAVATADRSGVAIAPVLAAGATLGPVRVMALAPGGERPAVYTLRVVAY
jgi:hypothetical protein